MSEAVYVYRLVVEMPEGWFMRDFTPENWNEIAERHGFMTWGRDIQPFRWPRRRNFFSSEAAWKTARLLTECGAKVEIQRAAVREFEPCQWQVTTPV